VNRMTPLSSRCARAVVALVVCLGVAGCGETYEDVEPQVMFEDAAFRILDVNVPPGSQTVEHTHAHDMATVSMSAGTEVQTEIDGDWGDPSAPRPLGHAAVSEHAGMPVSVRVRNTGEGTHRMFAIENLRTSGWSTAPPIEAMNTTVAAESRAFRVYDVNLAGDKAFQVSHTHEVPVIAIMMGGKVISEGGEVESEDGTAPPSGLKQLDEPGQWVYIPPGAPHYVVRIGTEPVRAVEVELR
jgi:quercetin dioxygenase-like cupin family protein